MPARRDVLVSGKLQAWMKVARLNLSGEAAQVGASDRAPCLLAIGVRFGEWIERHGPASRASCWDSRGLQALGVDHQVTPSLMRGLDYYQDTVFEFVAKANVSLSFSFFFFFQSFFSLGFVGHSTGDSPGRGSLRWLGKSINLFSTFFNLFDRLTRLPAISKPLLMRM